MRDITIATAQFEARDGDKAFNQERVEALAERAVRAGAEVICFHECCLSGYTFLMGLERDALLRLAEPVPGGRACEFLAGLARRTRTLILAGLLEREGDELFNTCVAFGPQGFVARHRKLHAFINPHVACGDQYTVFEYDGVKCGILICYDNNLPENVRVTALMGAEVVFMPHVTCGTQSPMPGRGVIAREVWENRHLDPVRCRQEFQGPKGRAWLMKWLPARAFENGVYVVFANAVGIDHDTVKTGLSMIIDPFGEILVESAVLGDDVVAGRCAGQKITVASGLRYRQARRPELYGQLMEPPAGGALTSPGWRLEAPPDAR